MKLEIGLGILVLFHKTKLIMKGKEFFFWGGSGDRLGYKSGVTGVAGLYC